LQPVPLGIHPYILYQMPLFSKKEQLEIGE